MDSSPVAAECEYGPPYGEYCEYGAAYAYSLASVVVPVIYHTYKVNYFSTDNNYETGNKNIYEDNEQELCWKY